MSCRANSTERRQKESGANVTDNGKAVRNATTKRTPKRASNEAQVQPGEKVKNMLKMVILRLYAHRMTCEQREQVSVACGGRGVSVRGGAAPPRANARARAHKAKAARAIDVELRARAAGFRYVSRRAVQTHHRCPHEHAQSSSDQVERTGLPNKQSRAHK